MLTPIARLGQMSLSASIVLSGIHYFTQAPPVKALTAGEHYVATGGWGTAVYWSAFLLLGAASPWLLHLWSRMARSIAGRGPLEAILALISGRG